MVKIPIQGGANLRTQKKGKVLTEAQSHSQTVSEERTQKSLHVASMAATLLQGRDYNNMQLEMIEQLVNTCEHMQC